MPLASAVSKLAAARWNICSVVSGAPKVVLPSAFSVLNGTPEQYASAMKSSVKPRSEYSSESESLDAGLTCAQKVAARSAPVRARCRLR